MSKDCSKKVSLPVLGAEAANARSKPRSTRGKWRAAALIGVHVAIGIHIVLWLIMGSTVSPVEPSEAMQTLEFGAVNAGAIFFLLAIISTLIFGRFVCGWGCHVVALQDLCAWMMKKIGIHPKPFRSRLLVWVPLILGLYMFVWPSFKRAALFPLIEVLGGTPPIWLGAVVPLHGFHSELIVEDFWATFPPWYVAIPFFLVVGFACVYVLGAKGFCTYGCPYGGIFGVADQLSPGRIVVNDDCHQCGHCTAVCTSNVRVHEEVRDFGMVVDPGCMKCLDCVSACPNDALRFAFDTPPLRAKPIDDDAKARRDKIASSSKRFDLTWGEEIGAAAVFLAMFLGFRGWLNEVPMLMAVGMAGIGSFGAWKLWQLATSPNSRLQNLQLKTKGRITRTGIAAGAISALVVGAGLWGLGVNTLRYRAHLVHENILIPLPTALRPEFEPDPELGAMIDSGVSSFRMSSSPNSGGYGWALSPQNRRELAFLAILSGDLTEARRQIADVIRTAIPTDELVLHLAALNTADGEPIERNTELYESVLAEHPELASVRSRLIRERIALGVPAGEALSVWHSRLESDEVEDHELVQAALLYIEAGLPERANAALTRMQDFESASPVQMVEHARALAALGRTDGALQLANLAENKSLDSPAKSRELASFYRSLAGPDAAGRFLDEALRRHPRSSGLLEAAAVVELDRGARDEALRLLDAAAENGAGPWEVAALGESTIKRGFRRNDRELARLGLAFLERASAWRSESPTLLHDLGQAQLAMELPEQGMASLRAASAMAPGNEALARAVEVAAERLDSRP